MTPHSLTPKEIAVQFELMASAAPSVAVAEALRFCSGFVRGYSLPFVVPNPACIDPSPERWRELCRRAADELQEFVSAYRCQSCPKDGKDKCAYCEAETASATALLLEITELPKTKI